MMMNDYIMNQIRKDFAAFADPATEIEVGNRRVSWVQQRERKSVHLTRASDEYPGIRVDGRTFKYEEFFASHHMADLAWLADELPNYVSRSSSFVGPRYVPGKASTEGKEGLPADVLPADTLLAALAKPLLTPHRTQVIFLKGRAGDGKSTLLTQMAYQQAKSYAEGKTTWLYFYIDAQARSLSRIDEAVALILQDMRARFTYHALATLTRLGLVVPIIDGFDELLGIGGYRDAFSSLELFIRRLQSRGALIASARATFYQYSTFGQQARLVEEDESIIDFEIKPVNLHAWTDSELSLYIKKAEAATVLGAESDEQAVRILKQKTGERAEEILASPLLASKLIEHLAQADTLESNEQLVKRLIHGLVQREMVEKMLDKNRKPLLDLDGHLRILGALADEMWWLEARYLDNESFATVTQMICEELKLTEDAASFLIAKMTSHAVLAREERPPRWRFRHELYFAFFLGNHFAHKLTSGEEPSDFLRRATISPVVAKEFASALSREQSREVIQAINQRKDTATTSNISATNAGTLLSAVIMQHGEALGGSAFIAAIFDGVDLAGSFLTDSLFKACQLIRVDLRGARWVNVTLERCTIFLPALSESTRLELRGLEGSKDTVGLIWDAHGVTEEIYDPNRVVSVLAEVGCLGLSPAGSQVQRSEQSQKLVEDLDAFLRVVRSTHYFSEEDFENRKKDLYGDYGAILDILIECSLVEKVKKSIRRDRAMYSLRARASDIRAGQSGIYADAKIEELWSRLDK